MMHIFWCTLWKVTVFWTFLWKEKKLPIPNILATPCMSNLTTRHFQWHSFSLWSVVRMFPIRKNRFFAKKLGKFVGLASNLSMSSESTKVLHYFGRIWHPATIAWHLWQVWRKQCSICCKCNESSKLPANKARWEIVNFDERETTEKG